MIKAIITDLDGTLLPRGGSISSGTLEAFRLAGNKGCIRIIATGRNLYSALKILPAGFPIDYLVFSSGAGTLRWSDRRLLSAHHLSMSETREIASYLWEYNINFTIQREIPDNHYFYYTTLYPIHPDYQKRLATYRPFGSPIDSPAGIQGKAHPIRNDSRCPAITVTRKNPFGFSRLFRSTLHFAFRQPGDLAGNFCRRYP